MPSSSSAWGRCGLTSRFVPWWEGLDRIETVLVIYMAIGAVFGLGMLLWGLFHLVGLAGDVGLLDGAAIILFLSAAITVSWPIFLWNWLREHLL